MRNEWSSASTKMPPRFLRTVATLFLASPAVAARHQNHRRSFRPFLAASVTSIGRFLRSRCRDMMRKGQTFVFCAWLLLNDLAFLKILFSTLNKAKLLLRTNIDIRIIFLATSTLSPLKTCFLRKSSWKKVLISTVFLKDDLQDSCIVSNVLGTIRYVQV